MEPRLFTHYERWRYRRLKYRRYSIPPRRLTPRQVSNLVRETERYLDWRFSIATDQEVEAHDCHDLIERVRAGGWITPDDSEMPQPESEDSYDFFMRRNRAGGAAPGQFTINGERIR